MRGLLVGGIAIVSLAASCDETTGPNLSDVPGYLINSVRVSPSIDTVFLSSPPRSSDRAVFTATATGKNGGALAVSQFAWSTSNSAVAVVDENGVVTPLTTGTVEVTASADKIGKATLVILPATISVTVTPAVDTIFIGSTVTAADTARFLATARDLAGAVLGGVVFEWSSSTPSVATVGPTGLVRAVSVGIADINVTANGHNGSARVHVIQTASQTR